MFRLTCTGLLLVLATLTGGNAFAGTPRACSNTATAAFTACLFEKQDDYWIAVGKCKNVADGDERADCLSEARDTLHDDKGECKAQRAARRDLCAELGEEPYDPPFEPSNFVNPADIGGSVAPNPFLPIIVGRTLVYRSPTEEIRVTTTEDIKLIDGVPCAAIRDTVTEDGEITEDTIDWFAQDLAGNVWYCGEATAEYEDGIPVNTDGSFQAGVEGAKAGILMEAQPQVGDVYRQEFDLGNAEDASKVIALDGSATVPATSCTGDCVVTEETTALEPDALEHKYYKAGIGDILEVSVESGTRTELVEIIDQN